MKTYSEFKKEIGGIKDVSEVVKTIEKISASKIHFLRKEIEGLEQYSVNLKFFLQRLLCFYSAYKSPLLEKRIYGKRVLLVVTSNKGLVGGLWHRTISRVLRKYDDYDHYIVIGKKGIEYMAEEKIVVLKHFAFEEDSPRKEEIHEVSKYLFQLFEANRIKVIDVLYPDFISVSEQKIRNIPFLPFDLESKTVDGGTSQESIGFPIFGSSKRKLFENLLKKYINSFFYQLILEMKLSEYSARAVEMENAFEKSKDLIKEKEHFFLKEKRKSSTQKQLESFNCKK